MRRLAVGLALLLMGCEGCVVPFHHAPADPGHHVRVLWVTDSIMEILQPAADSPLESMYQVTEIRMGKLGQPSEPGDSAYLVVGVVPCQAVIREPTRVRAECPNPHAPTIHVHPHVGDFAPYGNNCSPSRPDYLFQLQRRHSFDAILCGSNTRPTAFWYENNPLLGTKDYPRSLKPLGPDSVGTRVDHDD